MGSRVFDLIKEEVLPDNKYLFCQAAVASEEDFETMQGNGMHWNKTLIWRPVAVESTGIPINSKYYEALSTVLKRGMNHGILRRQILDSKP